MDFEKDDPEYATYKEEKQNTQKMSSILKSVQESTVPKRREITSAKPPKAT